MTRSPDASSRTLTQEEAVPRIPVTVITGYLGSGKTTLLNRILTTIGSPRVGVVVNEFGTLAIDPLFIVDSQAGVMEMRNGCVCCSVRDDLLEGLLQIGVRSEGLDALLIETSGLAEPAAVAQLVLSHGVLAQRFTLDGVVTVVDAAHNPLALPFPHTAESQIACADVLLLNKADLADPEQLTAMRSHLRHLNPHADIHATQHGHVPLEAVLGLGAYSGEAAERAVLHAEHHDHEHDDGIGSVVLRSRQPVAPLAFDMWLTGVLHFGPGQVLRTKGIVNLAREAQPLLFQGVLQSVSGEMGTAWPGGQPPETQLVFIGRDLDEQALREGFESCLEQSE